MCAMRLKSHWFKADKPKTMKQMAGAMAFITWRVTDNALKQLRTAKFDIDAGPQYFAFTSEFLVFLIQVADRIAHERLEPEQRVEFTTELVIRLSAILEENEDRLLGPAVNQSYKSRFIDLFNELSDHYAEFKYVDNNPDFAFVRYLGSRVTELMVAKDRTWVMDQIMAIDAPDAIKFLQQSMSDLFHTGPRERSKRPARPSGD